MSCGHIGLTSGAVYSSSVPCGRFRPFPCQRFGAFLAEKLSRRPPKNHWRYDMRDMVLGSFAINVCMLQHSDHQWQTPRFGGSADTGLSTTNIWLFWWRQMTKLHPIPAHLRFQQVTSFPWRSVVRLLFFEQFLQSVPWDMKRPRYSAHTRSFMVGR